MTNPSDKKKRTPLEICAFTIATISIVVIFFSFSHIFGVGILSRIFSNVPEPQPTVLYPRFMILIKIVVPLALLLGSLYVILRFLKYVFDRERPQGYKPELILIAYSLILTALVLQYLENHIQPAGSVNEFLMSASLILLLLAIGPVVIAIYCKFGKRIDKAP